MSARQSAENDAPRRRTEAETRRCSQDGCPGDGRYQPPGRGHLTGCQHDAIAWVWETVIPPAAWDDPDPDDPPATKDDDPMWGRDLPPGEVRRVNVPRSAITGRFIPPATTEGGDA